MNRCLGLMFAMLGIVFAASHAHASRGNDLVKVAELADVSAIQPGKPFTLGFKFTVEPKWHIYWKNPGDSGLATQVKLILPDGFTAGELMFPVPERLQLPGGIINYAYQRQVMLMVQVTPPNNLPMGTMITISAKADFLVCEEQCIPGSQTISVELPVAAVAKEANSDEFVKWRNQLPQVDFPHEDIASDGFSVDGNAGHRFFTAKVIWKRPGKDLQFWPELSDNGQVGETRVATIGDMTMATFPVSDGIGIDRMAKGLIFYTSSNGSRVAFELYDPAYERVYPKSKSPN